MLSGESARPSGEWLDQAALHGLLQKLRDVGVPLISLTQVPSDKTPEGN